MFKMQDFFKFDMNLTKVFAQLLLSSFTSQQGVHGREEGQVAPCNTIQKNNSPDVG